jgi:alkylation response protein AidB-like acyl-CoA dehydrogenase
MAAISQRTQKFINIAAELADKFGERAVWHEKAGTFPYENYEDIRVSDFHTIGIPEEYGGQGGNMGEIVRAMARFGEGCASTALVMSMHIAQLGRAIELGNWPRPVLEEVLRGTVEHGYLLNNAASEAESGSPSRGGLPNTYAEELPNGRWRINGRKIFTTGAPILHYFTITATIQRGDTREVGNFIFTHDTPGVKINPTWNANMMRLTGSHDLIMQNVEVAPEGYLGLNSKTSPEQSACNASWGLPVAAIYFGIGRAAGKFAAKYARERTPNSLKTSIAELPHIQEKMGRLELALLSAENTLFTVADLVATRQHDISPTHLQALVGAAKNLATNKAIEATDLALRIVGAVGMFMDSPLQRYYRDARAGLNNPPMDDASLTLLGKVALGLI